MKKLLKKIGYGLLGLLVLLLAIGFLLPAERKVEVTEKINAPLALAFDEVNDLRNWESWALWAQLDPLMELSYSNPPAGKDAFLKWNSSKPDVGAGKLTIVDIVPQQRIVIMADFEKGRDSRQEFTFEQERKSVRVQWSTTLDMGSNPVKRYAGLFKTGSLRNAYRKGLENMKRKLENR